MRIVKEKFLRDAAEQHPKAAKYLAAWVKTVRAAAWHNLAEMRGSYPSADMVLVGSGKRVIVFTVCGNTYRLIVAMHFDCQMVYTLRFLTHARIQQRQVEGRIMKAKPKLRLADMPKDYAGLCGVLLPRPIRDGVDYSNVAEVTDAMVMWRKDFTADQRDYFDMLCKLIEEHDAEHVKWPKVKGREILQHLLDEQNLAAADLSRILGVSRNLGAMILRGDRNLTLGHIRKLAARFNVSPELFV